MLIKSSVLWFAILIMAILNGILREKILIPALGAFGAFLTSGMILSLCIFAVAYFAVPWYGRLPSVQWMIIGAFWLGLTLLFEFGFGFLQRKPLHEILAAYTFKDGNIWPLVLFATFFAPWLMAKWRRLI